MVTHSSILASKILWTAEPKVHGVAPVDKWDHWHWGMFASKPFHMLPQMCYVLSRITLYALKNCLFIFDCAGSSLLHRLFSGCGVASHCNGFSCWGTQALGAGASVVGTHGLRSCGSQALEPGPSNCGTQALLLWSKRNLPKPGIKPTSPALASRFVTTEPPGKSILCTF